MSTRLYYVVPDIVHARQMFQHLLLAQVEARHIRILAKDDTDLGDLPSAGFNHKSDVLHGASQGMIYGGLSGLAVGLILLANPPESMELNHVAVLLLSVLGAAFGAWAASLVGLGIGNTRLQRFKKEIDEGKMLMIIDVPRSDVKRISHLLSREDPDASARGTEPTLPAFP